MSDAEVEEIDRFLAEYKQLAGYMPPWSSKYGRDHTARWGIVDSLGIQRGELCMTIDAALQKPSIVATCERRLIFRLDLVPASECEPNPFGAKALGLPPIVCGSHVHGWKANREFVRVNGFGDLPFREPVEAPEITFAHALVVTAGHLNLTVRGDQRDVRLPQQGGLFSERRRASEL